MASDTIVQPFDFTKDFMASKQRGKFWLFTQTPRVVIVTNIVDDRVRESARLAGACCYVLKENLSVLEQILNQ